VEVTLINVGDIIAYGLRCVSSNLKKHGVDTRMIFIPPRFADISHKNLFAGIAEVAGDSAFIGVSLMAGQYKSAVYLTENLKKITDAPVYWGGIHPTVCPDESIKHADAICIGEGEETAVALAKRMESGGGLEGLDGIWFKKGGGVVRNRLRRIPEDLDSLPPPDYGFDTHYVFDFDKGNMARMNDHYFFKHRGDRYTTLPTRGCAMNCSYCVNAYLHNMYPVSNRLRSKSIDALIEELKWVKENLKFIRQINFYDDDFLRLPMEYIRNFVDRYEREIDMPLVLTGISPANFNMEKLELISQKIRLDKLRLGVQSGSERTRKEIFNRPHSDKQLLSVIQQLSRVRRRGRILYDVILDVPWENEKDKIDTFRFLMKIPRPFWLIVYYLTFYPGTALYERAKKEGLLNNINDGYSQRYQQTRTKDRLNKIITLTDKMPRWFLWLLFYTRKAVLISDVLIFSGDTVIVIRNALRRILTGIGLTKRRLSFRRAQ